MRELSIIRRIAQLAAQQGSDPHMVKGIGDDCAIFRPPDDEDLVFTSDFVIEGRHFKTDTHSAREVGHKALARSLSDLAAMGAAPRFCLVSLALPTARTEAWIQEFYEGFLAVAERFHSTLAGGDLSQNDKIIADVMCCGSLPRNSAMRRDRARPGDRIFVTGKLGGTAASMWKKVPMPRIWEGISARAVASAGMDLSDGLSIDLHRLCEASRVCAALVSTRIPIADGATLPDALHGGEDYELLVTIPPQRKAPLYFTEIGVIGDGPAGTVLMDGEPLQPAGFEHFING